MHGGMMRRNNMAMGYKKWILTFLLLLLICNVESRVEETSPKSTIRTIQSEYGQIIDCVDLYSQPSLDHPLLQNHTIQMHPTSIPHDIDGDVGSIFSKCEDETSNIECPIGSVPILRSYGVKSMRSLRPLIGYNDDENANSTFRVAMVLTRPSPVYGSQAKLSVYEPDLGTGKPPRFSQAMLSLQNGSPPNMSMILVGWVIDPNFYGDNHAHFQIDWIDNGLTCTNLRCNGFVQLSTRITPGLKITPVSTVGGDQYDITVMVYMDKKTGNWVLTYGRDYKVVGYWPKELFTYMADAADSIRWHGLVAAARGEPTPPMGSGQSPDEGRGKAAYFENLRIVDADNRLVVPNLGDCETRETEPNCYKLGRVTYSADDAGMHFLFGGAGCPAS